MVVFEKGVWRIVCKGQPKERGGFLAIVRQVKVDRKSPYPSLPGGSPPAVAQRPHGLLGCPRGGKRHEAPGR